MALMKIKARSKVDTDKKPRIYFTCHPYASKEKIPVLPIIFKERIDANI